MYLGVAYLLLLYEDTGTIGIVDVVDILQVADIYTCIEREDIAFSDVDGSSN